MDQLPELSQSARRSHVASSAAEAVPTPKKGVRSRAPAAATPAAERRMVEVREVERGMVMISRTAGADEPRQTSDAACSALSPGSEEIATAGRRGARRDGDGERGS